MAYTVWIKLSGGANQHRLSGTNHFACDIAILVRFGSKAFANVYPITNVCHLSLLVKRFERHCWRVKHLADFFTDEIVDVLDIEFCRKPLLHAVDDRKLCGALLGFFEQMLCLVEETNILDCNGGLISERC